MNDFLNTENLSTDEVLELYEDILELDEPVNISTVICYGYCYCRNGYTSGLTGWSWPYTSGYSGIVGQSDLYMYCGGRNDCWDMCKNSTAPCRYSANTESTYVVSCRNF